MARSGTETRERILDGAERLVLDHGLAATTVDAILAESETSKGAFFHHFPSKNHLARALVERYAAGDVAFLEEFMAKAEATVDDPAMKIVEFIRRFEYAADEMVSQQPSCLYVSYVFEKQLFEDGTNDVIVGAVLARMVTTTRRRGTSARMRSKNTTRSCSSRQSVNDSSN